MFLKSSRLCFLILWFQNIPVEGGKCLGNVPGPVRRKKIEYQGKEIPLGISYSNRVSHQVIAQLTKILLQEGLGYDNIVFIPYDGDINGTAKSFWKDGASVFPRTIIDPEVWVPFDAEVLPKNDEMIDVGSLGVTGRQGWYVRTDFVDNMWTVNHQTVDHWRALQLPIVLRQLSVPSDLFACGDCVEQEFHPKQCLNQSSGNCAALLGDNRDNSVLLKNQITSLRLNISVIWLKRGLDTTLTDNQRRGKPLLFYTSDPGSLSISGKFKRIAFPECSMATISATGNSSGCDFPLYDLHKFVWKDIQQHYQDIYRLVRAITLTREHIADILQNVNTTQKESIDDSVCQWLNKTRDVWFPWIQPEPSTEETLYIGGMFPSLVESKAIWSSPGDEVGAQMAVEEVNDDQTVLGSFKLELLVAPTQCRRELVIQAFIRYLNRDEVDKVIGILGPACSRPTLPIAEVSRFYNTIIMGYGADDVSLSDRTRFPMFFQTNPSIDEFKSAYLLLFRTFDWTHCVVLREAKYPVNTVQSRIEFLTNHGIQVLSRELPSNTYLNAENYIKSIAESKVRVIILDAYPAVTRAITCQAYIKGLTPDKGYVWFLLDWLESDWWDVDYYNSAFYTAPESVPCTTTELRFFVDQGYFTLSSPFFAADNETVQGGQTVKQWKKRYAANLQKEKKQWSDYASFAHDAVWTYALAMDRLLKNDSSALRTINSNITSAIFRQFIQEVDFLGVSGRVHFKNGDRLSNIVIKQKFALRSLAIGHFIDANDTKNPVMGQLVLDPSQITWATGQIPPDRLSEPGPKNSCGVESLRQMLGVSCGVAIIAVVLIVVVSVSFILTIVACALKKGYSSKYRDTKNRLRELGLLHANFSGAIFALDDWETSREKLILNRKLGEGAFGAVYGGEGLGLMGSDVSVPIAAKALRTGATIEDKIEFLNEADNMKLLSHPNIVKLIAVCTTGEPVYIVMELMIHGDLKSFLLARRRSVDKKGTPEAEDVTPRRLTNMALDIARGLQYLTDMKFVHRDLALRNCMVGFGNIIKIGDFGLAQSLQESDFYRFKRKAMLPVRWMSPESIREGLFTPHTDVWSFGITIWEVSTVGGYPYQSMSNAEVLEKVDQGYTLEAPCHSSSEMKALLRKCWSQDPLQRPKPSEIVRILMENPELVHACIDVPGTTCITEK